MAKIKTNFHIDWLNLTFRSGLVLSEPVLLEKFPDGFKVPNNWTTKQIKQNYEKFDLDDSENGSLKFVDEMMYLLKNTTLKSNAMPNDFVLYLHEYAQELKPQRVLEFDKISIPLYITSKNQSLKTNENLENRWKASPIAKIERLLKGLNLSCGIVTNGYEWRLIYASNEGSLNHIEFDFESIMAESKLLNAFTSVFSSLILNDIKQLAEESHKKQIEITDKLGLQVRESVKRFVAILDTANKQSNNSFLQGTSNDTIYQMSVTTIIKLVFVLYAEQKSMLPHGELLYDKAYGLHTLISELTEQKQNEMLAHRNDAYQQLIALFNIIYNGSSHPDMQSPRYGGEIFDPAKFPLLQDSSLSPTNEEVYEILWLLTHSEAKIGKEIVTQTFSYHSLNVEHIGYIYEGLLSYSVDRSGETPLVKFNPQSNELAVKIDELINMSDEKLGEFIKSNTQQNKAPTAKQLEKRFEPSEDELQKLESLEPKEQEELKNYASLLHEVILSSSLYITTSTKRRATGAHYTPEALTAKMVKATLDPHVYVIASETKQSIIKSPKEILSLKVADIAMGSGAFLVQAIRYLSDKLVESWQNIINNSDDTPLCMPYATPCQNSSDNLIPKEYEEQKRFAKRFISRECIYGVDINPLAVEIAKISIWLETLDKNLPFTFIDHALKHGDSLVGVVSQDEVKKLIGEQSNLFDLIDDDELKRAIKLRREVESLSDLEVDKKKELFEKSEKLLLGAKTKLAKLSINKIDPDGDFEPFSYMLEFPEVMIDGGGFDAIIGNPPFLGGKKISSFFGDEYAKYLRGYIGKGVIGSADFVAYFFLRAFALLKQNGTFGLLASNTIAEGDTRDVSLAQLVKHGEIYAAFSNEPWEGQAAVVTSRVHFIKGSFNNQKILNGVEVEFISPFLSSEDDKKPNMLIANKNRSFQGTVILGLGFTMEVEKAQGVLRDKLHYADVLMPYINGQDLNSSPAQEASRYVINFWDWSLERAKEYPELLAQCEELIKPERDKLINKKEDGKKSQQLHEPDYWKFWDKRPKLYHAIGRGASFEKHPSDFEYPKEPMERVLSFGLNAKHWIVSIVDFECVFTHALGVCGYTNISYFSLLQSTIHDEWARKNGSSLGTGLRYTPSDCFETFPFPQDLPANPALCDFSHPLVQKLEKLGEEYHVLRREMMQSLNIGLTKLYNAFHSKNENRSDFVKLRKLHRAIDESVKEAYGWNDLDLAHGFYEVPYLPINDRVRYTISENARLEILRRLYKLNTERYTEELANGLWNKKKPKPSAKKQKSEQIQGSLF